MPKDWELQPRAAGTQTACETDAIITAGLHFSQRGDREPARTLQFDSVRNFNCLTFVKSLTKLTHSEFQARCSTSRRLQLPSGVTTLSLQPGCELWSLVLFHV